MTHEQAKANVTQAVETVVQMIHQELANSPEGAEAALGDGTFLALLLKLLPLLLEILKNL